MSKVIKGRILYSQATYQPRSSDLEKGGGVSLTVPSEAMSLRHILEKHARGIDPGVFGKEPVYFGGDFDDEDMEEVTRMDLADRSELAERNRQDVKDKELKAEQAKAESDAAAKAAAEKAENELYEKFRSKDKSSPGSDQGQSAKGGRTQKGGTTAED